MSKELLIEIGTEELPSNHILSILDNMEGVMKRLLKESLISFGEIKRFATPRRLTLHVNEVSKRQSPLIVEVIGPPKKIAYDEAGIPTRAAMGFAASQGIRVEELKIKETKRGEYLSAIKKSKRRDTRIVLRELLPSFIDSISLPKSMRWDEEGKRFIRPIRWILTVYGGETICFKYGKIDSSNISYGHRFMSPRPFTVKDLCSYLVKTEKRFVIVDYKKREKIINYQIDNIARRKGGIALKRDNLLEDAVFMVEYPVAIGGSFDKGYLDLPRDVIIAAIAEQQGYFPIAKKDGRLLPYFITIVNIKINDRDMRIIRSGNERVVRARLEDARFFFEEDQRIRLSERVESLKRVVFLEPIGSLYEKVKRLSSLSSYIASLIGHPYPEMVKRAASLCKADLITGMVGEFPKLQGIIGGEYARIEGEKEEVADAIAEHYLPRFSDDSLPTTDTGIILAIADRLDTLIACIGIGLIPTGSEDPYALRRQAIGVIQILIARRYRLSLNKLIDHAIDLLGEKVKRDKREVRNEIISFFIQRMDSMLNAEGYPYDIIDAVLSNQFDDPYDSYERIVSLTNFQKSHSFIPMVTVIKRITNILRSSEPISPGINRDLLQEKEERGLYDLLNSLGERIYSFIKEYRYEEALREMVGFIKPIDDLFDTVLVMHEDKNIRENRLSLLRYIKELFYQLADFSMIVLTGG